MIKDFKTILAKKDIKYLYLLFFGMLIAAVIEMVGLSSIPLFIMVIIDINVLINKFPDFFVISYIKDLKQSQLTIFGGIALIGIFLVKNLYLAIYFYFQGKVIRDIRSDITNELFNKYLKAPYKYHIQNNPAYLIRSITSNVGGSINTILSTLSVTKEALVLVVIFILLFLNEPLVSISVFFTLSILSGTFLFFTRKELILRGLKAENEKEQQLRTINHSLGSIKETKILNREKYLSGIFNQQVKEIEKHSLFLYFLNQVPKLFLEFIAVFSVSIIAILFVVINLSNEKILPVISLLAVCSIRLIPAFNIILSSLSTRRFSLASLQIVADAFKNTPIEERFKNNHFLNEEITKKDFFKTNIIFKNVFFAHENSKSKILKNISLEINCGQKIGIIGKSGSGKSTLIDLVVGLIEPVNGKIYVDGRDMQDNLNNWQKLIGYVPQDIYLIDDTIKNNIAFGLDSKNIDEQLVLNSIKLAKLEEFVNSLEKKENTVVGNRGIKVSGGQKQRIGIARALYNDPKVLILDEATSSLDTGNEKQIMDEVYKASKDRTLLVITHRHSSVINCDKVYLLDEGEIIDSGSYENLQKRHIF